MIDKQSIEALKSSIDIVDVIGSFIELKKAGANYKAPCPFHGEKTPSFVVSPSKQIYHCFGCGAGGDAIKFMMDYEKLNYPEAIEKLASMFNFSLRYTQGSSDYSDIKRVLQNVETWYRKNLEHSTQTKEYLHSRGISQNSIEKFAIGYAPDSQSVINFINSLHIPIPKAIESGVIAKGDNGRVYARLTDRVIFPIYSPNGAIVGFGGRTMSNHPAKYINSPQTKLFNKSRLLYGYHLAKDSIYKQKQIIICEGYLDVIMLHQAGFNTAVATLGTALTSEHLPILRKGEPKIILAYDGDKAGVNAALKASMMLSSGGFDGGVVLFPNGQDPADMIANDATQEVAKLLRDAKPLIPFVLEQIASSYDLNNPRDKESAFNETKSFLNTLSPIFQDSYIPMASTILKISPSMFTSHKHTKQQKEFINKTSDDIAYLSVLKTFMENPTILDEYKEKIDSIIFDKYQSMYEDITNNNLNNPNLTRLSIDVNIKAIDTDELKSTLSAILIKHYNKKLKEIASSNNIPYQEKSFKIRKIRTDIIPRLKKGEIVSINL